MRLGLVEQRAQDVACFTRCALPAGGLEGVWEGAWRSGRGSVVCERSGAPGPVGDVQGSTSLESASRVFSYGSHAWPAIRALFRL